MASQREGSGTPRSAVINFSRPFPSPSLPPPGAQHTSTTFAEPATTMTASQVLPESPVKGGQSSPASPPASYSVPNSGSTFTRDDATKEQRATGDFLQHLPTQQLSSSKASIVSSTKTDSSSSSSSTIRPSSVETMTKPTLMLGQDSPIKNFRPKLWKGLDTNTNRLQLDLFWPVKTEDDDDSNVNPVPRDEDGHIIVEEACLPLNDFAPILNFRNLSMLHLEGMMRSYQPIIWQVVWSNPNLVILNLEMALEPLFNVDAKHPNRIIDSKWTVFPTITADSGNGSTSTLSLADSTTSDPVNDPTSYLGTTDGNGTLSAEYGDGEYLDVRAITTAHLAAANASSLPATNLRYLPVRILRLRNIIVDGLALSRWFNPSSLACITFKPGCIDAGFYLPPDMQHVKLQVPPAPAAAPAPLRAAPAAAAATALPRGLKLIELRGGKVVSRVDAAGALASASAAAAAAAASSSPSSPASASAPASALERFKSTMARMPSLGGGRGKENRKKGAGEDVVVGGAGAGGVGGWSEEEVKEARKGKKKDE